MRRLDAALRHMISVRALFSPALVALVLTAVGCFRDRPAQQKPQGSSGLPFAEQPDGEKAFDNVRRFLMLGPKPAGEHGAAAAARYIARELELLGLAPITDEFEDSTPHGTKTFRNVMAVIPGRLPGLVVIAAHYDTKTGISEDFAGANDSGSGVGAVLEIARAARSAARPMPDIMFAFFDGEECKVSYSGTDGLHGSRRLAGTFVKNRRAGSVLGVFVLDMVGDKHLTLTIPANGTPELRKILLRASREERLRPIVKLAPTAILDDHSPFLKRGMPALDIIDFEYGSAPGLNDYWHTAEDTIDKLSPNSMDAACRLTLRAVALLAADAEVRSRR
jgi:hypothetical protein